MVETCPTWGERALSKVFGSEVRAKVIAQLCAGVEEPIIGRELARVLGSNQMAVSKELRRLEDLGMLRAGEKMGRVKPYYVNEDFPLLPGLRSMVQYAVGAVALLREKLGDREDIDAAFIYGSVAAGDDRPGSDVDVMVIGQVKGRELSSAIREVERRTRRQVNEVHYSRDEFAGRVREGGSFVPTVLEGPKVFLKGDEDALRELAG